MCRIFGFRSISKSQVHQSLLSADNALRLQGVSHPDGWGVSYYVGGTPHIVKSASSAFADSLFHHVSGVVSSQTVVAHLRKATVGDLNIINTHPFQYGRWVFVHNGNIKNFKNHREKLLGYVDKELRHYILGSSDSELIFYLLLTQLKQNTDLHQPIKDLSLLVTASQKLIVQLQNTVGEFSRVDNAGEFETYMTFLITDGKNMLAHHGGKDLYYSTHKKKCSERDACPYLSAQCETPDLSLPLSHMLFSSEPLSGENVWSKMSLGEIIAIDENMTLKTVK